MRPAGWQRMLSEYVLEAQERYKREGFAWGRFDCCTFVGGWVHLMTGVDHMAQFAGKYSTREEAIAILGGSLKDKVAELIGPPVHVAHAGRGDIAIDNDALGLMFTSGRLYAIFLGDGGFVLQRAEDCECAFRVG